MTESLRSGYIPGHPLPPLLPISKTLKTLDFSDKVNHIEPSDGEQNYMGNKVGLTAQFIHYVCDR